MIKILLAFIERIMQKLYPVSSTDNDTIIHLESPITASKPVEVPLATVTATTTPTGANNGQKEVLLWDTPPHAYHSTRVLCDEQGLTVKEKNLICAVIYQESRFKNSAKCENKDKQGNITSVDYGIVQVNSYWHIGKNKTFPSIEYVLNNPEKMVRWIIQCYKNGQLKLWVGYSSGAYKQWLGDNSPMKKLKV